MATSPDLEPLFARLRAVMQPYGRQLVVTRDLPGDYYVETRWVRDDGYHGYFGSVATRTSSVNYYLMALYAWPELLDGVDPALRRRMSGKSCFRFTALDDDVERHLADLTERSFVRMRDSGADVHPRHRWTLQEG